MTFVQGRELVAAAIGEKESLVAVGLSVPPPGLAPKRDRQRAQPISAPPSRANTTPAPRIL